MPASNSSRHRMSACHSGSATPNSRGASTATSIRSRCRALLRLTSTVAANAGFSTQHHHALVAIQRPPSRSRKQSARVIGHNRSALTRNLNERGVIVHTTPLGRVDRLSTSRNDGKHEQRGNRERTANFHGKVLLTNDWL